MKAARKKPRKRTKFFIKEGLLCQHGITHSVGGGQQLNRDEKARLLEKVKPQLDEVERSLMAGSLHNAMLNIADCQETINVIRNSSSPYQSMDRKRREQSFLKNIRMELKKLIKEVEEAQYWEKQKGVDTNIKRAKIEDDVRKLRIEDSIKKLRWIKETRVEDMIQRYRRYYFGD